MKFVAPMPEQRIWDTSHREMHFSGDNLFLGVCYEGSGLGSEGIYKEGPRFWTGFKTCHGFLYLLLGANGKDVGS